MPRKSLDDSHTSRNQTVSLDFPARLAWGLPDPAASIMYAQNKLWQFRRNRWEINSGGQQQGIRKRGIGLDGGGE